MVPMSMVWEVEARLKDREWEKFLKGRGGEWANQLEETIYMMMGMVEAVNSVRDEEKVELMRLDKMEEEELVALTAGQHWRLQKLQEKVKEWQKNNCVEKSVEVGRLTCIVDWFQKKLGEEQLDCAGQGGSGDAYQTG